jgi:2-hydroxy-3-oxopropionate reductase
MSNIGFIGLGIMGKPMALNLIKGGHKLFLNSRSGVPQELRRRAAPRARARRKSRRKPTSSS